ncbi:MAG: manganese efflux pump MntP family protein [Syntrophales bacterium]|nr:manganese efflux pump MntP family protein [Syntrophales bacterium]
MNFSTLFVIAFSLGMDAFSVAFGVGAIKNKELLMSTLRISVSFGMFQFAMPILGWSGGKLITDLIGGFDHWIAFGLLTYVGFRMIREGMASNEDEKWMYNDPTKGFTLFLLSIATSIDAFAVGLSFAFLKVEILYSSIVIGVMCSIMTASGMLIGSRLGNIMGKRAAIVGGVVLVLVGLKILMEHF